MDKLLLIDDEADVQYSLRRIFDQPEIELTTADSGEEGLKLIPRLKPGLVIMDARMGGSAAWKPSAACVLWTSSKWSPSPAPGQCRRLGKKEIPVNSIQ
jgi:DNA-binding NarL/FixJ family response regulator